jgi:DNA repair protein RecO
VSLLSLPAVLLRSHPWGESSHILRFLTPDEGLVAVVARGVRRVGGKGNTPVELFAGGTLQVDLRPGRELHGFRGFDVDRHRGALAASVVRFGAASFLGEFVLRQGGEEPSPPLFDAVVRSLDRLGEADDASAVPVLVASVWNLVSLMGYTPELECCVLCGAAIPAEDTCRFDHAEGGVRGEECGGGTGPRIGPSTREALRRMLGGEEVEGLPKPSAHLRLVHDFLAWHLGNGRPLESFGFLSGVVTGGRPAPEGPIRDSMDPGSTGTDRADVLEGSDP